MLGFEKYKLKCCKTCATDLYINMCEVCPAMRQRKIGWRAALRWYKSVAAECEKDCHTDEDYKILYFHLKQVLKNESGN